MRYFQLSCGIGLCLALLWAGCAPQGPIPDDTLVIGQSAEPRSLDPHVTTATNDFRIMESIYEGLVRFADGTLEVEPSLAESWEISEDGLRYRFTLREDVRFHDGTRFDAEAVVFNFDRMRDPDHPWHHTGPFPLSFFFVAVDQVEAVGSHQVVFHLSEPFAPLLANLAYPPGYMVSPHAVEQHGDAFGRNPAGTGPFRFVEWSARRAVYLERNPDYHGSPPPLREIVFRPISDENARLTELLAGGCDIILEVPADMVAYFRDDREFRVAEATGAHLWFLILNLKEGVFADQRIRRAANHAIDRNGLAGDLLQDTAAAAYSPFPAVFGVPGSDQPIRHDPEKARRLLRESGYAGETVTMILPDSGSGMLEPRAMAESIQADLAAIGMNVTLQTFEWNTYLSIVNGGLEGRADMAQMAWMTHDPDTLPYLALRSDAWPEHGGFNSGYFANEDVDRWLRRARMETEPDLRLGHYASVDEVFRAELPWLVVASWRQNAVHHRRVASFELEPSFLFRLANVRKTEGFGAE